jgi:hypothetical protein
MTYADWPNSSDRDCQSNFALNLSDDSFLRNKTTRLRQMALLPVDSNSEALKDEIPVSCEDIGLDPEGKGESTDSKNTRG